MADDEALQAGLADEQEADYSEQDKRDLLSRSQGRVNLGDYVRLTLAKLKFKHFKNFASKPLVVSFPTLQSDSMGFSMVRFKKHRFYTNLLKSFDPVILAAGFHKYQSIPHLAKKDASDRLRLIKYTPQHDFCLAIFYGPFLELNTGVAAFQSLDSGIKKFRVAGTGVVVGFSPNYEVKKKLRLVGEPFKIYKNTSFVKNMFNSKVPPAHRSSSWPSSSAQKSKPSAASVDRSRRSLAKAPKAPTEPPSKTRYSCPTWSS